MVGPHNHFPHRFASDWTADEFIALIPSFFLNWRENFFHFLVNTISDYDPA